LAWIERHVLGLVHRRGKPAIRVGGSLDLIVLSLTVRAQPDHDRSALPAAYVRPWNDHVTTEPWAVPLGATRHGNASSSDGSATCYLRVGGAPTDVLLRLGHTMGGRVVTS